MEQQYRFFRKGGNKFLIEEMDEWNSKLLDEGYFKSYPEKIVIKTLSELLTKNKSKCGYFEIYPDSLIDNSRHDEENDFQILTLAIEKFPKEIRDNVENKLSLCGWYISKDSKEISDNGERYVEVHLEPKYPNENSIADRKSIDIIEKHKIFYHVSFKRFKDKILKNGLVPSNLNRIGFAHPDRIYLFSKKEVAKDFADFHRTNLLSFTDKINKRKTKKSKEVIDADPKYQDYDNDSVIIFKVDLKKMLDDKKKIVLYHDNRFNEKDIAYFTQNSIHPKYLKQIFI